MYGIFMVVVIIVITIVIVIVIIIIAIIIVFLTELSWSETHTTSIVPSYTMLWDLSSSMVYVAIPDLAIFIVGDEGCVDSSRRIAITIKKINKKIIVLIKVLITLIVTIIKLLSRNVIKSQKYSQRQNYSYLNFGLTS